VSNVTDLHRPLIPILRSLLTGIRWPRTGVVLDLGCGDCSKWGLYRELLGDQVQLIGIDHSIESIRAADKSAPGEAGSVKRQAAVDGRTPGEQPDDAGAYRNAPGINQFVQSVQLQQPRHRAGYHWPVIGDAHGLPFRSASIDAGICVAALGLFENHQRALSELRRVLKPGAPVLLVTAERRWAQVVRWPAALARRLEEALAHTPLTDAIEDLTGDMAQLLLSAGLTVPQQQAFLFEPGLPPRAAALALQPWYTARPLLRAHLTDTELVACDALAAEETIDLCSVVLACVGSYT
jgi:ubiquinone/menaquinone biosynthesis C-methylase UbiE